MTDKDYTEDGYKCLYACICTTMTGKTTLEINIYSKSNFAEVEYKLPIHGKTGKLLIDVEAGKALADELRKNADFRTVQQLILNDQFEDYIEELRNRKNEVIEND
jgi:chaperonin cofactor prefoldin